MKRNIKNKKGVSLLVLSVTIIIMVILASVAIANLEDTGVVELSNKTVNSSNKEAVQEKLENLKNTYIVDNFGNANIINFLEYLLDEGEIIVVPSANADGSYTITTTSNYIAKIEQDGESNLIITVEGMV